MWIRSHLSFANVVSLIALFVALGGTSVAAVTLAKNSVGARQIKTNAVTASEIKANAVAASELRSGAVRGDDVADGSIGAADLGDDSVGAGEVTNRSLAANDLRAGLLNPDITIQRTDYTVNANSTNSGDVACPADQIAVGGGASTGSTDAGVSMLVSRPGNVGTNPNDGQPIPGRSWRSVYRNSTAAAITARVYVLCVEAK